MLAQYSTAKEAHKPYDGGALAPTGTVAFILHRGDGLEEASTGQGAEILSCLTAPLTVTNCPAGGLSLPVPGERPREIIGIPERARSSHDMIQHFPL